MDDARIARESARIELSFDEGIWSDVKRADADRTHGVITVLGERGARVKVLEPNARFKIGSAVSLRFQLPGASDHIRCGCVVRDHVSDYDIGVEFTLMAAGHREQLSRVIAYWSLVAA